MIFHFHLYVWSNNWENLAMTMTGEIPTRYGMESRPSRSNIHLLHSVKTDEIEVLESGAMNHHTNIGNGNADHSRTKVWIVHSLKLLIYSNHRNIATLFYHRNIIHSSYIPYRYSIIISWWRSTRNWIRITSSSNIFFCVTLIKYEYDCRWYLSKKLWFKYKD